MRAAVLILAAIAAFSHTAPAATCKPDGICTACKDCTKCGYCAKAGKGSCSVCRNQTSDQARSREAKKERARK